MQQSVTKKTSDHTTLKVDLLAQDISDLHSESDPEIIIKLLYGNAIATISDLLEPHLKAVKKAAGRFHHLGLHHVSAGEGIIESANTVDSLLRQMSATGKWDQTRFLRKAIDSIPYSAPERSIAEAILSHYQLHLAIYERTTLLKDALKKEFESEEQVEASSEANRIVPLTITSPKAFDNFSCEDCYIFQVRGLSVAYGNPEETIICRDEQNCHLPHSLPVRLQCHPPPWSIGYGMASLGAGHHRSVHPWSVHLHSLCGLLPVTAEGKQDLHWRPTGSDRGEGSM